MIKLLGSFLKEKRGDICLYIGFIGVFYVIFSLSNLPVDAVNYAFFLSAIWLLGYGIFKFHQYYKNCVVVIEAKQRLEEVTENLPDTRSYIELEYQAIIQNMYKKMSDLQSAERIGRQEMKDYYSMWAHQIKTPIAALNLLLQEEKQDTAVCRQELFKIESYVEMALNYLRFEEMSNDLVLERNSLEQLVRQVVKKYAAIFIYNHISVQLEHLDYTVLTDEKWFCFVLEQILSNALKYTKQGSVNISAEETEKGLKVLVCDTGIGIKSEDLPRIFEKGFTGYNGRMDKKASGLGLYLCKGVCEKLGHGIRVTSKEGKGTTVILTLQCEKVQPEDLTKM